MTPPAPVDGHSREALARKCANYRKNLRQLQRAYDRVWAWYDVQTSRCHDLRERLEQEQQATERWRRIAGEERKLDVWLIGMLMFASFLLGATLL